MRELWRMNCAQVAGFDEAIADKDNEIELLRVRVAKLEGAAKKQSGSRRFRAVEPPKTHSKLPCRPASPSSTVVRGGSVWSNHLEHTRNFPVDLLPQAEKWFEEVRCGRTTPNSFETAL